MENGRCVFKLTCIAQDVRNVLTRVQSGGFMGDLIINGGDIGLDVGNQQFTVRNVTINGSNTGVKMPWNWGWNFQGITIRNAKVGFDVKTGSNSNDQDQGVGGVAIMDGIISDTPIFYRSSQPSTNLQGSIVLNNIKLTNVQSVVAVLNGGTILQGSEGETIVDTWVQGNIYVARQSRGYHKGGTWPVPKDPSLLENGRMFGKGRPTYADYDISQIVSVKDEGAKGDGRADDTLTLQAVFDKVSSRALLLRLISNGTGRKFAGCKIIFFDAGTYLVTDTLKIPAGVRIFGEAWAVIAGTGSKFDDIQNPQVVVQVGDSGSEGIAEIGGVIFSTRGPSSYCTFEGMRTRTDLQFQ
jgi:glucan 1,3-beta-glucosidase